jgi:diguanylate cyclase (GGDEF)-like protein
MMSVLYLDTETILVTLIGVSIILVLSMNLVLLKRKTYPGFGWWTAGITIFAISCVVLTLRSILPVIFSVVLANVLFVLSGVLLLEGTRIFRGKKVRKAFIIAIFVFYSMFQSYFTFIDNNIDIRIAGISFLMAVIYGLTALELFLKIPPDFRFSHWITGSMFAAYSIFMLGRGIYTSRYPSSQNVSDSDLLFSLTFMVTMLLGIGWTIRFIILNSENLENDLKRTQIQLKELATTDALTGIANRRHFLELAEREFQRTRRHKHDLSILMIDLDYFKKVNDNYGHAVGDKVLIGFADICRKNLREIDIFGRLGGEEFAILLPQTSIHDSKIMAERLCSLVPQSDIDAGNQKLRMTISIGVAVLKPEEDKLNAVLKRADDAMYEAKRNGRNQVVVDL